MSSDYALPITATGAGTINPAPLDIYAASQSRVYDGTTVSSARPTVSGLFTVRATR